MLPLIVLAIPILDTALVTLLRIARAAACEPGRPRPHLAPARLLRPLGAAGRRRCSRASRSRSARPASPTTCSTTARSRLIGVLVTFVLLVQFASFLADARRAGAHGRRAAAGLDRAGAARAAPARGGRRRLRAHVRARSSPRTHSSSAGSATTSSAASSSPRCRWCSRTATSASSSRRLPPRLALRRRATTSSRSPWPARSRRSAHARSCGSSAGRSAPSRRSVFLLDAIFCTVLVVGSRIAAGRVLTWREHARRRAAPRADRRRRALGPQLRPRAARDTGSARRRLPRRQPGRAAAPDRRRHAWSARSRRRRPRSRRRRRDEVVVTIADAPPERLQPVVAACEEAGLECRFMRRTAEPGPTALAEAHRVVSDSASGVRAPERGARPRPALRRPRGPRTSGRHRGT